MASIRTDSVYKILALLGLLLVLAVPYAAWKKLARYEFEALTIVRQSILAELDLQSLHQQLAGLEQSVYMAHPDDTGGYSKQQLQILQRDTEAVREQILEASASLEQTDRRQQNLLGDIKLTLAITLIALSLGLVFIVSGLLGWHFHIRIIEERRLQRRD